MHMSLCELPGIGDGQGGLECCNSWGIKESDTTEWLNRTEPNVPLYICATLLIKYFLIKVCTFLDKMLLTLNRLQCNVNVTLICTGKPKNLCNLLYCNTCSDAVVWNKTHNISKVCLCTYGERQTDRQRHRETDRKEKRDDEMETERSSWLVWNL